MTTSPADSKGRFSDRVENYVRYRPRYPEELFDFLQAELRLAPGAAVADIGSGTGISAEPLLQRGFTVYGIEPNGPMRSAAEGLLGRYSGFRSVDASAEVTTLPEGSVDLVIAAQAFHWFDHARARAEFGRILRSPGHVALFWNERKTDATPFLRAYEQLLLTHATDYAQVRHENVTPESLERFFAPAAMGQRTFANHQHFDFEGLKGRLLSSSYAPPAGHPGHGPMLDALRRIFDEHQRHGRVTFEYDTRVYYARVR